MSLENPIGAPSGGWTMKAAAALIVVGVIAFLIVLFSAASKPDASGLRPLAVGPMRELRVLDQPPPQPERPFADANGREMTLKAFRGQVLVLNIWATFCPPCVHEMPTLAALQERYADHGLHVAAVSIDAQSERAEAQALLQKLADGRLSFYIDPSRAIGFDALAVGMPTTIIYDRHGQEVARLTGGADWASPEAAALIERVLETT